MAKGIQTYKVADFCFEVEDMPFYPANLQPFKMDSCTEAPIFNLKVVPEHPETESALIYKTPEREGLPVTALYSKNGGYLFEMQTRPGKPIAAKMITDSQFNNAELAILGTEASFSIKTALMLLFTFNTAKRGALEIHASAVIQDGKGYLFLGKSGTGKSTHSQLWLNHIPNSELLNDDNPILRLMPDGTARVYGSPWSGKTPCYKSKDAPVGAIIHLSQANQNKIERLPLIQAYTSLLTSCPSFRPINSLAEGWHHTMEGICAAVPFYRLECLPNKEAALLCHQTVTNNNQI